MLRGRADDAGAKRAGCAPDVQHSVAVADSTRIPAVCSAQLQQQLHRVKVAVFDGANKRLVDDLVSIAANTHVRASVCEDANGAQVPSAGR